MAMKAFRLVVCFAVVMAILRLGPPTQARQATPVTGDGIFQPAACMVALPAGFTEGVNASCGYLVVPLKHAEPNGPTINLAVVRLKSTSSSPAPEPLVMLNGGPGGSMEHFLLPQFAPGGYYSYAPFLDRQDVIVFDQRGAGKSQPALDCPVSSEGSSSAATPSSSGTPFEECLEEWRASGVDLTAFRTAESAADVESLRMALGYEQIDLYGVSYGTRLALEIMRDYPNAIRSAVLSSPLPPQVDPFAGQLIGFDGALTAIFSDCAADSACNEAFPNLESKLETVYTNLNERSVPVKVTGQSPDLYVDGAAFLSALYVMVYGTQTASYIPAFLDEIAAGNAKALETLVNWAFSFNFELASGDLYSVTCQDEAPFSDRSTASAAAEAAGVRPMLLNKKFQNWGWIGIFAVCDEVGFPPAPANENVPVKSSIPTLVFTGEYDPITPPAYGELLANDLSELTLVRVRGVSHSPMDGGGACTIGIAASFLASSSTAIDTGCLSVIFPVFPTTIPQN